MSSAKWRRPGVFTLPPGSRIVDAIAAAGGALPHTDLTALDLARKLSDGQEIFVGVPPPSGAAAMSAGGVVGDDTDVGAGTGAGAGSADSIVNINSATQAELETLPGVGAVTAQKILAWRTQHGRFTSVTQLQQVLGHRAGEVRGARRAGEGVKSSPRTADVSVALMPGEPVELRLLIPAGVAWLTARHRAVDVRGRGLLAAAVLVVAGAALAADDASEPTTSTACAQRVVASALLCAAGAAAAASWRVAAVQRGPLPSLARAHATVTSGTHRDERPALVGRFINRLQPLTCRVVGQGRRGQQRRRADDHDQFTDRRARDGTWLALIATRRNASLRLAA